MIWTFALQDLHRIYIYRALRHPALLAVCRQVRSEAKKLYFWSNNVIFIAYEYDASLLLKWCDGVEAIIGDRLRAMRAGIQLRSARGPLLGFKNLLQWCKWVHEGRTFAQSLPNWWLRAERDEALLAAATEITRDCRRLRWYTCWRILCTLCIACHALNKA